MIRKILVGVSGTPSLESKIEITLDLARRHGAAITLMSIVDVDRLSHVGPVPVGAGSYAEDLRRSRVERSHRLDESGIERFRAVAAAAGVDVSVVRREGSPVEVFAAEWRHHDLSVLGAKGWFDYGVVAEPEGALLRLVSAGVRPLLATAESSRPIRRVLVCYNGSMESAKAMKQFAQFRAWPDAAVEVACVGGTKTGEPVAELLERATGYLGAHGYKAEPRFLEGESLSALLSHVSGANIDMIVAGSSFRRILLSQRFGRHALGLIRKSPVALFLSH